MRQAQAKRSVSPTQNVAPGSEGERGHPVHRQVRAWVDVVVGMVSVGEGEGLVRVEGEGW